MPEDTRRIIRKSNNSIYKLSILHIMPGGGMVYSEHNTEEITWSSILQPQATAFT